MNSLLQYLYNLPYLRTVRIEGRAWGTVVSWRRLLEGQSTELGGIQWNGIYSRKYTQGVAQLWGRTAGNDLLRAVVVISDGLPMGVGGIPKADFRKRSKQWGQLSEAGCQRSLTLLSAAGCVPHADQ